MNEEQLHEIRRYLASLRAEQTVNIQSYAVAIHDSFGGTTKELQEVIRREAINLGVTYT